VTSNGSQRPVALTMGDPAGIGPEIALKAWAALRDELALVIVADAGLMSETAGRLGLRSVAVAGPDEAAAGMPGGLPVLDQPLATPARPGRPDGTNAPATVAAIERAVSMVQTGKALAVVTNPVSKQVLAEGAGFAFPGHTEFLAHLGGVDRVVMMLAAPELRVVPVTIHIALADVPSRLTPDLLDSTLRITDAALRTDFGIAAPRIAVAGLNPHAGEGGLMGHQEATLIVPVLDRLRAGGLHLSGPHAADSMFHAAARAGYDAAVAMYHDQALIPLKTLNFAEGVNVTLGLPFVRTSPDHGTAFDIAGTGQADASSLIAAIRMAASMAARRSAAGA
jgi:4-hydroxythreonine-4-phosphate dehydrogenase